ncbi:MAG: MauE/DoxX family redox-associated membrane protein [Rubritalea sp.]|jgi:uncharacterized membrane protein YphA (DoxX/SURF4 family)|tara:strand:+ start:1251 stop:1709 length:459 start_codon:yes stop_codon:yes gene_type:complete
MNEGSNTIEISLRVILGSLFIWAGTMKILDVDSFVETVGYFKIAPFDADPWDMWLGYMLPVFEILVGGALILGILLKGAITSVLLLTVGFLVAVISAHLRGLNIECGCFGKALSFTNYHAHIGVLVVMTLMAAGLVLLEWRKGNGVDQNNLA